jgi:hypothetical protein
VFANDGTLLIESGFCAPSGILVAPSVDLCVPDIPLAPSLEDVSLARYLITDELFGDFPFVSAADRAHAIGLLLAFFCRDLIDGTTPLHAIDKPAPGTGAGLLLDVITIIVTGEAAHLMAAATDEEEWRKRLTAKLLTSPLYVAIDNVNRRLDSASLSSAITASVWEDRPLGVSQVAHIPVRALWIVTGNNIAFSNELARRSVRIRLDARTDRPWLRRNFRHADLPAWTREHRNEFVWAALVLIRAWLAANRSAGNKSLGSFNAWAHTIGGILDVTDVPGFLGNSEDLYEVADAEGAEWRRFVTAWWETFGSREVGISELWTVVVPEKGDAFDLGLGDLDKPKNAKTRLGKRLSAMRERQFGPFRIETAGVRQRARRWRLLNVGDQS